MAERNETSSTEKTSGTEPGVATSIPPIILILPILSMNNAEMMLPGSTAKLPRKETM